MWPVSYSCLIGFDILVISGVVKQVAAKWIEWSAAEEEDLFRKSAGGLRTHLTRDLPAVTSQDYIHLRHPSSHLEHFNI